MQGKSEKATATVKKTLEKFKPCSSSSFVTNREFELGGINQVGSKIGLGYLILAYVSVNRCERDDYYERNLNFASHLD